MSDYRKAEMQRARALLESAQRDMNVAERLLRTIEADIVSGGNVTRSLAEYREEAVRFVLEAVIESMSWRGLNRRRFKAFIAEEARRTPCDGPASIKHAVLHAEACRVLGIRP